MRLEKDDRIEVEGIKILNNLEKGVTYQVTDIVDVKGFKEYVLKPVNESLSQRIVPTDSVDPFIGDKVSINRV